MISPIQISNMCDVVLPKFELVVSQNRMSGYHKIEFVISLNHSYFAISHSILLSQNLFSYIINSILISLQLVEFMISKIDKVISQIWFL